MTIEEKIVELNEQVATLQRQLEEEQRVKRESVKHLYRYMVTPVTMRDSDFDMIYDNTCKVYNISRRCLNIDELKAAGRSSWDYNDRSLNYLYNTKTNKLVHGFGGGTIMLAAKDRYKWECVSIFIYQNPEGGDITEIMTGD